MKLTARQKRFVAEYLVDLNATQAAIRAGYSRKAAKAIGCENLTKPDIALAVEQGKSKQLDTTGLSAARVLEELRRVAMVDTRSFFHEDGSAKAFTELTAEQGACIAGFEVIVKNAKAGDGVTDTIHKFKLWDKTKALDLLAKHFGLLIERIDQSGEIRIIHELPE